MCDTQTEPAFSLIPHFNVRKIYFSRFGVCFEYVVRIRPVSERKNPATMASVFLILLERKIKLNTRTIPGILNKNLGWKGKLLLSNFYWCKLQDIISAALEKNPPSPHLVFRVMWGFSPQKYCFWGFLKNGALKNIPYNFFHTYHIYGDKTLRFQHL